MAEASNTPTPNLPTRIDWRTELAKFRRPGLAQIGILAGVAALLALLVVGALWVNTPNYDVLYRGLADADAGQIMEVIETIAHMAEKNNHDVMQVVHEIEGLRQIAETLKQQVSQFKTRGI